MTYLWFSIPIPRSFSTFAKAASNIDASWFPLCWSLLLPLSKWQFKIIKLWSPITNLIKTAPLFPVDPYIPDLTLSLTTFFVLSYFWRSNFLLKATNKNKPTRFLSMGTYSVSYIYSLVYPYSILFSIRKWLMASVMSDFHSSTLLLSLNKQLLAVRATIS